MTKTLWTTLLFLLLVLIAIKTDVSAQDLIPPTSLEQLYTETDRAELNDSQLESLGLSGTWVNGLGERPFLRADGALVYAFGRSQPTLVCALFQVCLIEMEPGEQIVDLRPGDGVRWKINASVMGRGPEQITVLTVKPTDIHLKSSLFIATNRRGYHIDLRSTAQQYMPRIAFNYPQNVRRELVRYRQQLERMEQEKPTVTVADNELAQALHIEDLDFNYTVKGTASWTPTRVYNDGVRTIFAMPEVMLAGEAPVLTIVDEKDNQTIVTHRLATNRFGEPQYIVDTVVEKAMLVVGAGSAQEIVTIEHLGRSARL